MTGQQVPPQSYIVLPGKVFVLTPVLTFWLYSDLKKSQDGKGLW